jgi:hypothetical protein
MDPLVIYIASGAVIGWLAFSPRPTRECPRCGRDVRKGLLDCPHCEYDFRAIGGSAERDLDG